MARRGRLWKYALTHVVRKISSSIEDHFPELCVLFHEGRDKLVKESENVVADQHLAVAMRSRADANRGNFQPGSQLCGNRIRNRFEN